MTIAFDEMCVQPKNGIDGERTSAAVHGFKAGSSTKDHRSDVTGSFSILDASLPILDRENDSHDLPIGQGNDPECEIEGIVGNGPAIRRMLKAIRVVAPTTSTVLILGETGTGKELISRAIHDLSARRDRPFIKVNCASIPRDLYESEFFGHVRGAFTGAIRDRVGRFEAAHTGTLFLDEIAEIPIELQSKLLRTLQEREYERVGDERTKRADVRIVAATNRDLKREVEAGRFREDLYYRLNVFPIEVAPLRERLEDIPLLAQHLVCKLTQQFKSRAPRLTGAGVARLQNYNWPGNVRELRNVIERATIVAQGKALEFDLPHADAVSRPLPRISVNVGVSEPEFLTEPEIQRRERDNLRIVLQRADWKIKGAGGAAELLGVKPTTLLSRIKKMGLKRDGLLSPISEPSNIPI
jgi:transcriptional regulator with GAF, ATPase, and Fis domain